MGTRSRVIDPSEVAGPILRVVGGVEPPKLGLAGSDGRPAVVCRVDGWPLEARVWHHRPAGVPEAVYHPSGVWLAVRLL